MKSNFNKVIPLLLLAIPVTGRCAELPVTRAQWLMGTVCEIQAWGPRALEGSSAAFAEIARLERVLSLYREESELSALNREAFRVPFRCSPELWEALSAALSAARESGGAFDPTILPLRKGPSALGLVGHRKLALDSSRRSVRFTLPGMGIDPGGIGKGLALDHAAAALRRAGVRAALINFGGQIYALGSPPGAPGWRVRAPGLAQELLVKDASVSTSGDSERPGHILSPFTGLPLRRHRSVTVVAPTGAQADAWSTALFVLHPRLPRSFHGCVLSTGPGGPRARNCARYLRNQYKGETR